MKHQVSQQTLAEKSKLKLLSKEERAHQKGVRFIAINSSTLDGASKKEGQNLWKEVEDGIWDVIEMGPR